MDTRSDPPEVVREEASGHVVTLTVDGRNCDLKPFMHHMIGGSIMGLVAGLKGVGQPRHIVLEVRRADDRSASRAATPTDAS